MHEEGQSDSGSESDWSKKSCDAEFEDSKNDFGADDVEFDVTGVY